MSTFQLGILVLDSSGSMGDEIKGQPNGTTKAWQIEEMIAKPFPKDPAFAEDRKATMGQGGFIAFLGESRTAAFTDLAIFRYDTACEIYQESRPLKEWKLMPYAPPLSPGSGHYTLCGQDFDLLNGKGGGTNIAEGLRHALACAQQWLEHIKKEYPGDDAFVTIILMSDLLDNDPQQGEREVLKVANEIKNNIMIKGRPQMLLAAAAFGDDAKLDLMDQVAHHLPDKNAKQPKPCSVKTSDPRELRDFFISSMSAQIG